MVCRVVFPSRVFVFVFYLFCRKLSLRNNVVYATAAIYNKISLIILQQKKNWVGLLLFFMILFFVI